MDLRTMNPKPLAVKIRYLGRTPRTFTMPIPFISKTEAHGKVVCDPIGEFPAEEAEKLMNIPGAAGVFEVVEFVYPETAKKDEKQETEVETKAQEEIGPECQCGCGEKIIVRPHHKATGIPKFIKGHHNRKKAVTVTTEG